MHNRCAQILPDARLRLLCGIRKRPYLSGFYTVYMNNTLRNDILSAYGTCDFLSSLTEADFRGELEEELLRFVFLCSDSAEACEAFARDCLLDEHLDRSRIDHVLHSFSPAVFKAEGSRLLDDFSWADEYFQTTSPEFPCMNQNLLYSIYGALAEEYGAKGDWLKRWIESDTLPARSEDTDSRPGFDQQHEKLEASLRRLDDLIGLEAVKTEIRDLCAFLEISRLRQSRGLRSIPPARHLVFSGNPGTGKTTTARILADIYKNLGFLSKGQLVECDRSDLVGEYIGSSAQKTKAVINRAKGGVLFIDEAYSLARGSEKDFGREAIEILLKEMEDNRSDLVVIAAGYPDLMETFLASNPGLRSRFTTFLHFENYTGPQLLEILEGMLKQADYRLDDSARKRLEKQFDEIAANPPADFANGRYVRNRLEAATARQARRLFESGSISDEDLITLSASDFEQPAAVNSRP